MKMENLRKRGWHNSVKTRVRSVQVNLLNLNEKDSRQSLYQNALFDICVSINVKPECVGGGKGGRTPGICGAIDLFCLSHPPEFD